MSFKIPLSICLGVWMLSLSSCSKDKGIEPSSCFDPTFAVSYQNDIVPILNKSCRSAVGCHASGANPQPAFADYNAIKIMADNGRLRNRVLEARDMPALWGPDSVEITDCERELFKLWLDSGAPNN